MALGAETIPAAGGIADGAGAGTGTDAKPAASSARGILLDNLLRSLLHVLLLQPDSLRCLAERMAGMAPHKDLAISVLHQLTPARSRRDWKCTLCWVAF